MSQQNPRHLKGSAIAWSSGIVIGRVQKLDHGRTMIPEREIQPHHIERELQRLISAINSAVAEMDAEIKHLMKGRATDPVLILEAHRMLMLDPELVGKTKARIKEQRINAEWALRKQMDAIKAVFEQIDDHYLRERKNDVEQVGRRILRHLMGEQLNTTIEQNDLTTIVLGEDFSPADMVTLWRCGAGGVVAERGGIDAHNIIVARGIGLPALVGVSDLLIEARDGDKLILDAEQGVWILNPTEEEVQKYGEFVQALTTVHQDLQLYATQPSLTADGHHLPLMANMEFPEELEMAQSVGAEGIGLYRTEFLFMNSEKLPTENEELQCYSTIVAGMKGKPVTLRLLDVGGDKSELYQQIAGHSYEGSNPAMGLRGIRLLLHHPEILKQQISAMVQAAAHGPVQILIPMVTHIEEILAVRQWLQMFCEKHNIRDEIPLGAMIEVPAAAILAEKMAEASDFLSLGTNDLIQYTLAVDRADEEVSSIYKPDHEAVVKLIRITADAAHRHGIPVSVCGELAGDPDWTQTFLDLGMDSLSMSLNRILPVRQHLSHLSKRTD